MSSRYFGWPNYRVSTVGDDTAILTSAQIRIERHSFFSSYICIIQVDMGGIQEQGIPRVGVSRINSSVSVVNGFIYSSID